IDFLSVVRAVSVNRLNYGRDRRPVGASTITQQVAKNFLLTNEVSLARKIKEAILAFRIERALGKDRIFELYLNEIYLGLGSYGVGAAALNYFNKSLDELTIEEAAYLAALPKAPNNYHPRRNADAARARRNWVIGRMFEEGFVIAEDAVRARAAPLITRRPDATEVVAADHFAEEVRRELVERYGESALYRGGLSVRATLDSRLQKAADRVLRAGLETYDRRHGWRGPLGSLAGVADMIGALASYPPPPGLDDARIAVVSDITGTGAEIAFADIALGNIPAEEITRWRPWRKGQKVGPRFRRPGQVLAVGDVVAVSPLRDKKTGGPRPGLYRLRQIPTVDGALIALDPHTGRVLAMSGGYSYRRSQFNRATQARRQPGSAFKPFVYLAALDSGHTPATIILDAPFVLDQGPGLPKWKPANYTKKFYGPSPMRLGIEKSRNLMTVRLAQDIGMEAVADVAERFGLAKRMPRVLSMALGAGETSLIKLTTAYAMLVNGGRRIVPTLIDRVQDRHGRTVFRHDTRPCPGCRAQVWTGQEMPRLPDDRARLIDPVSAYQMVSMLRGVVERGTGRRVRAVGKPLAGKTGTTNKSLDTWFVGFAPDLAVGVFVGFDKPRSLGVGETGSSVAAPIFRDFMAAALAQAPAIPFRIPPGVRLVRIDPRTGALAGTGAKRAILESFRAGTEPRAGEPPRL
ncbi:MAG: penicillin-binding protein 1A, partial [Alphaproteobacteria bacterium]